MSVPALRFHGFSEHWETFTLNEICSTFKSGFGITSEKISGNGLYPVYGGNGLRGYTSQFTHDGFYALIGRQGALCGNVNIANGKSFISEHAVAVQANEYNNTKWLAYKLELMKLNRLSESSAQPGLSVTKLVKIEIEIPKKQEQTKIADFLTAVDEKITQLTKKHNLLTKYKKGVMQQIFSQELRFKDEDGRDFPEWENKLISEALNNYGGTALEEYVCSDGTHNFISIGNYEKNGNYFVNGQRIVLHEKTKKKLLKKDE